MIKLQSAAWSRMQQCIRKHFLVQAGLSYELNVNDLKKMEWEQIPTPVQKVFLIEIAENPRWGWQFGLRPKNGDYDGETYEAAQARFTADGERLPEGETRNIEEAPGTGANSTGNIIDFNSYRRDLRGGRLVGVL